MITIIITETIYHFIQSFTRFEEDNFKEFFDSKIKNFNKFIFTVIKNISTSKTKFSRSLILSHKQNQSKTAKQKQENEDKDYDMIIKIYFPRKNNFFS